MKLQFEITREDYADFNKFDFISTKLKSIILTGIICIVIMLLFINSKKIDLIKSIVSTLLFISIYFYIYYIELKKSKNIPITNGSILGRKYYEFSNTKIKYKTANSEGLYEWNIAKIIKENKKAFYIYIDKNLAIVIPKRAFKNIDEIDEFRKLVYQNINSLK